MRGSPSENREDSDEVNVDGEGEEDDGGLSQCRVALHDAKRKHPPNNVITKFESYSSNLIREESKRGGEKNCCIRVPSRTLSACACSRAKSSALRSRSFSSAGVDCPDCLFKELA